MWSVHSSQSFDNLAPPHGLKKAFQANIYELFQCCVDRRC